MKEDMIIVNLTREESKSKKKNKENEEKNKKIM